MPALLELEIGHFASSHEAAEASLRRRRFEDFRQSLAAGRLPVSIPLGDRATIDEVRGLAAELRERYDTVLLVGIGGSTLGFRAALEFVHGPYHNAFSGSAPRVFVVDNVDPTIADQLVRELDFRRTLMVYISKSGSTPEPAANFLIFLEQMRAAGGRLQDVVVICDRADNGINRIAGELDCNLLHIPGPLPGRYSVLSSAGLLPCELVGIDSGRLVAGARAVHEAVLGTDPAENPCFELGNLLHDHLQRGRNIHFLFSYSNRLSELNLWFTQLWSESLGKRRNLQGEEVRCGATPVVAVGATDQHSILQLLKEGPHDKAVGFLRIGRYPQEMPIPHAFTDLTEYAYFGGHSLAEQLAIEQLSTQISLSQEGTPCYSLTLGELSAECFGALVYFWELLVIYYAALDDIDPFDQPGVEEGKRMTYSLMGRGDHAEQRAEQERRVARYRQGDRVLSIGG